jgi:cyclophilin family peptidyl-prolyl cis-trans isomerase
VVLDPGTAPETVNSFVFLAEAGYFDGTVWHRVFPGFILQAGDPTGTGRGGPGYTIADEFPDAGFVYTRGTLAMANAGPGSTGSQFFIVLAEASLPPQYSVFGGVVSGDETLDAIAAVPLGAAVDSSDPIATTPLQTIYIESISVAR